MAFVVAIEIFDFSAVEGGGFDVFGGADALVHDRLLDDVAQLELHLRSQVARCVVIGVGDDKKFAVNNDRLPPSNVACSHDYLEIGSKGRKPRAIVRPE